MYYGTFVCMVVFEHMQHLTSSPQCHYNYGMLHLLNTSDVEVHTSLLFIEGN